MVRKFCAFLRLFTYNNYLCPRDKENPQDFCPRNGQGTL